jgi:alpha-galactosidase
MHVAMGHIMKTAKRWITAFVVAWGCAVGTQTCVLGMATEELATANQWLETNLGPQAVVPPFSFVYGGQPSSAFLKDWTVERASAKLSLNRMQHTLRYVDPKTGLEVQCVAIAYRDFPVVEWTVFLKNGGREDTPILENILGLDATFQQAGGEFVLNGIKGDFCTADSYEPYRTVLEPNMVKKFAPAKSGKSCDGPLGWPYYNLQMADRGIILAIGWPGQWASTFARDAANGLRITAGQELTHLRLKPGEEIRTPLVAMLFWRGTDVVASQNLWRRWYLAHVMPEVDGKPQSPQMQIQVGGGEEDIARVDKFLAAGIKPDICWRDAAWYATDSGPYKGKDAWLNTGTWVPDPRRYPKGFRPFSDWIHERGMKFVLWFEPERVGDPGSWLSKNHPEWLLQETSHGALLDEGNPEAWRWLVDHVDGMIKSERIDWYREDMNGCGPLPAWRKHDAEDRQGITENHYVRGHLAFWDELRNRNPGLSIDSCASGGRRNDLESMRRAVPLLRSDFQFPEMKGVVEGNQGHTYGLSSWLPFQGTGVYFYDVYSVRSFYLPSFGMGGLTPENTASQQKSYAECAKIAPCMLYGDYYPLTPYSLKLDQWIAWQFDRPEAGEGVVQAFRRAECPEETLCVRLRGLDPKAVYVLTNFDVAGATETTGQMLMENGLTIAIKDRPGSAIVTYRKKAN